MGWGEIGRSKKGREEVEITIEILLPAQHAARGAAASFLAFTNYEIFMQDVETEYIPSLPIKQTDR